MINYLVSSLFLSSRCVFGFYRWIEYGYQLGIVVVGNYGGHHGDVVAFPSKVHIDSDNIIYNIQTEW